MKRVAIEAGLSPIRNYLSQQGYQVEDLNAAHANQGHYAAIVISGQDQNLMGMEDIVHQCPVINARGLRPEEVHQRLQQLPQ